MPKEISRYRPVVKDRRMMHTFLSYADLGELVRMYQGGAFTRDGPFDE